MQWNDRRSVLGEMVGNCIFPGEPRSAVSRAVEILDDAGYQRLREP